jgi:peptide deformylase
VALLDLHMLGSPVLREKSVEITTFDKELGRFVHDLFETMYAADGVGLAANQVGVAERVAVVDTGDDGARVVLINPVVTEKEGKDRNEEGCLSIPDIYGDVDRPMTITVETSTLDGQRESHSLTDLAARAVLHEIDHLNGVLFIDHVGPLKRRMLLKKWKKLRKDKPNLIEPVTRNDKNA